MTDRDISDLLERAAGSGELPLDFTERVVTRSRSRRRRRAGVAICGLAALALGGVVLLPQIDLGKPESGIVASAVDPALVEKLNRASDATITADDVLATGTAGDETIVAVRRVPNDVEAAAGGKAAEIFISVDGAEFYRAADYISYDYACVEGDSVCEATKPSGLGMYVVRPQADGRKFVLVAAPTGRKVEVVTQPRTYPVGDAAGGTVVEVAASVPNEDVEVWVTRTDGQRYRLANAPGSTITLQDPN